MKRCILVIIVSVMLITGMIKIGKTMTNQFETRMNTLEQKGF